MNTNNMFASIVYQYKYIEVILLFTFVPQFRLPSPNRPWRIYWAGGCARGNNAHACMLAILLFTFNLLMTQAADYNSNNALTPDELFKQFLQSRPAIEEIIYSTKNVASRSLIEQFIKGMPTSDTNKNEVSFGRWNNDSYFLQKGCTIEQLNKKSKSGVIYGFIDGHYWKVNEPIITTYLTDSLEVNTIKMISQEFYQVLNYGLPSLKDASMKWTENDFSAETQAGKSINGTLIITDVRKPRQLKFHIEGIQWEYLLDYNYPDIPDIEHQFYPRVITSYIVLKSGQKPEPILSTIIHSLKIANGELTRDLFDPTLFMTNKGIISVLISNDTRFQKLPNGKLIDTGTIRRKRSAASYFTYISFTLVSLIALYMYLRRLKPPLKT
jgi:hypothetical protein